MPLAHNVAVVGVEYILSLNGWQYEVDGFSRMLLEQINPVIKMLLVPVRAIFQFQTMSQSASWDQYVRLYVTGLMHARMCEQPSNQITASGSSGTSLFLCA